ncbi:hypothetical protein Tcur_2289 [Thermomonospora curvata DSM 43183]|uniref:Uncharacterized protein n=1 Tax=Thermomonospora curvata (strain ATCC 19995 / DSM 43183 / JCM 3096 / KCTC 9072 / NBRC 15933 / NCIMB 10081 / Henssen B9) TaxID=471852 RepID=D1A2Q7_THECD|nr:hypothetical protein Tcur_2289 [Thermomonospora curvata DSM 43183]
MLGPVEVFHRPRFVFVDGSRTPLSAHHMDAMKITACKGGEHAPAR